MSKILFTIILLLFVSLLSCERLDLNRDSKLKEKELIETKDSLSSVRSDTFNFIFTGDIMMGTNYPPPGQLPPDDGKYLFDEVKEILLNADLTFGNLEGVLLNSGGIPKRCGDSSSSNCHVFRMPEKYAGILADAGFDVLSLANNHSNDFGEEGRKRTMETLDNYKIFYAGHSEKPIALINLNKIKIGFAAFAPNKATVSLLDTINAKKIIKDLKTECDIVIVSFHGGGEGTAYQNVKKTGNEIYLGENRGNVYRFAHCVIDAGADIVFGHGPHITRAVEIYRNRFIAYSLGNFCTYGKISISGLWGSAPIIKVFTDKKGEFIKAEVFSIKQVKGGFPVPDEKNFAWETIKKLTNEDFPDAEMQFIEKDERNFIIKNE